jgi:hypothetical protein
MLSWVVTLLAGLVVTTGGVAGITNAQNHAQGDAAPNAPSVDVVSPTAAADVAAQLEELATAIHDRLATAATHADSHAQDGLANAADATAAGLAKAADAVTNHAQPADAGAGAGDHPTPEDHPTADDHPGQ